MQSSKKSKNASSRTISLVLPATVGSSKRAGTKKNKRQGAQTSVVPAALGPHPQVGRPTFSQSAGSDGRVRVRHREFVMDVEGSVGFTMDALPINPAQPMTFPWLSTVAQSYETYVFKSLRFEYMPAVGTTVNGVVCLAVDYDALDPNPPDKMAFMQMHGAVRGSPWDYTSLICDQPDLNKLPQHFTRKSQWVNGAGDLKTYDVGNLFVATQGQTGTAAVGELYVTYDVELRTPQPVIPAPEAYSAGFAATAPGRIPAKPLGDAPVSTTSASAEYIAATGEIVFKRVGQFLLNNSATVGSTAAGALTLGLTPTPAGNATLGTSEKSFWNDAEFVVNQLIDVQALPFKITPAILGAAVSVSRDILRLAPYHSVP